jgi:thiol-disulfide isomerase/thioredoxin
MEGRGSCAAVGTASPSHGAFLAARGAIARRRVSARQAPVAVAAPRSAPAAAAASARLAAARLAAYPRQAAARRKSALQATLDVDEDGPRWWEQGAELSNARPIGSTVELLDALSTAGDRLVVVHFYAAWCAACKGLHPKVRAPATALPLAARLRPHVPRPPQLVQIMEAREDVLFLKVNYDENKPMSRTLGVKVLPTFHMYRGPSGRVAEFSASLSKIQRLRDALDAHGAPRCVIGDAKPVLVRLCASAVWLLVSSATRCDKLR